ncbi:hypothetical protein [Cryobacterium ruanii]|uniref:Uncharacterized protein n=1 Tax=Cryobacterium ruanii TaxID=1259197 RepID=A0A4R9AM08_9MICO|nr:hypothetical protein [Cryobacterium ruanii]TFD65426.1 hypothetical protein E3T47_11495 [Cryobacterium ruanii]
MGEMQPGQGRGSRSGLSRWVSVFIVILGAVTAVVGLVLVLLPIGSASFGWFAFAPLSNTAFFPSGVLLAPRSQIGIVLLIIGFALLAFGAGWALGQHQGVGQRRLPDSGSAHT